MSKQKILVKIVFLVIFILLIITILCNTAQISFLILESISQWLTKIIPTLFPFMMLQSCIHVLGLDHEIAKAIYPVIGKIFGISKNGCYCFLAGILFGFPMGAKVISEFYKENSLSEEEANRLLGFCNTFSPAYYIGFVYPAMLQLSPANSYLYIILLYLMPIILGLIMHMINHKKTSYIVNYKKENHFHLIPFSDFLSFIQKAGLQNLKATLMIGMNMIYSNMLRSLLLIIPIPLVYQNLIGSFYEITIGLPLIYNSTLLSANHKIIVMLGLISFGGLSGLFQTFTFILDAKLSCKTYLRNKFFLTCMTLLCAFMIQKISL